MTQQAPSAEKATSSMLGLATAAFAIAIFIADSLTHLTIAFAVLYVVVVLIAPGFFDRRGILLVGSGVRA